MENCSVTKLTEMIRVKENDMHLDASTGDEDREVGLLAANAGLMEEIKR